MKKIEAFTLEEAYSKASSEFKCSITDLDIEVIQNPAKGFFGFGKKSAIIIVSQKEAKQEPEQPNYKSKPQYEHYNSYNNSYQKNNRYHQEQKQPELKPQQIKKEAPKEEIVVTSEQPQISQNPVMTKDIFDNFYADRKTTDEIALEIENELKRLFALTCFKIDKIIVTKEDKNTILIEFDGEDAALLIGKEGYRYKALSYMLFNWINPKYNLMVKLEIAEFLKNQEEMIKNYLSPLIETIKVIGYGQTKPLDGVLSHIALKQLREAFPNKYVVTRDSDDGVKYVIVTDFKKQ